MFPSHDRIAGLYFGEPGELASVRIISTPNTQINGQGTLSLQGHDGAGYNNLISWQNTTVFV